MQGHPRYPQGPQGQGPQGFGPQGFGPQGFGPPPQGYGPPQAPPKKGLSGCAIAAIVLAVVGLLAAAGIAVGVVLVRDAVVEATETKTIAPGDEKETLATTRSAYVGEWTGTGATLSFTPNGHIA